VIFATSVHGFGNFELYLVDAEGRGAPVRVTHTDGFDGLPVFSPDGQKLSWASNRTLDKSSQIFLADWNDAAARELLGLDRRAKGTAPRPPETTSAISADDIRRHVAILASEEMNGRLTGSPGMRLATDYVASIFEELGLAPAGDDGGYFQAFTFTAGVDLGPENSLDLNRDGAASTPQLGRDWRPLAFSRSGDVAASEIAFAGYGIDAPEAKDFAGYDSYGDLDVTDKWVLVFRYLPEGISQEQRQNLYRYAELQYKAAVARRRGARGLLVVSGPKAKVKDELVPLSFDAAASRSGLAALSLTDALAAELLTATGRDLGALQEALDTGEVVGGFAIPGVRLGAAIDIAEEEREGRNVLARLGAGEGAGLVVIGAHLDHLGRGIPGKSLSRRDELGKIHHGADDNASGVAGLLEVAQYLVEQKTAGRLELRRPILFAAWSGEEVGTLGSGHFTRTFGGAERNDLKPGVTAYLNMDMIGRLDGSLTLQGIGSSSVWRRQVERANVPVGLSITLNEDSYLPSDALPFYLKGTPILSALSGVHGDYHSPRDTADKLNYQGAERIARLMALIARSLGRSETVPDYIRTEGSAKSVRRRTSRVFLGTIPDYAAGGDDGVRISGLSKNSPAEQGGLRPGDVVVEFAGKTIANIYDYSHALDALKIGVPVKIVVERDGRREELTLTPASRE
jgi:Zn-dependent M28 family amino/carboxypeptidase